MQNNSIVLESKPGGDYKPHPEGIHPALCVGVLDMGMVESEFQGQRRLLRKVRLFFETEQRNEEGKNCIIAKTFNASLHPKAKLAEFLGKWRGRPVVPGESIDLSKLIGACCTLVISHQQNLMGRTYAAIDAVSKPTKRLVASGSYDPILAQQRIDEWKAGISAASVNPPAGKPANPTTANPVGRIPLNPVAAAFPQQPVPPLPPSPTPSPAPAPEAFDPEVGF